MKVVTILGTRPEIIRLSLIIARLDQACDHVLVHTGQNFDPRLGDIFFAELNVRAPNHSLGVRGETAGEQIGRILAAGERVLATEKPDRLLLLGDTNSSLVAILAKRMGIPVYHMEAGNRCYDDRVPEEVNRRVIDHCSDVLMPYTERSRANLIREGIPGERIFVTGNPIREVIDAHEPRIAASRALADLGVTAQGYVLVTMHRAENVDLAPRLRQLASALDRVHQELDVPVIVSTHPRTEAKMRAFGVVAENPRVRFLPPFGFADFIALERGARCVLSDSGTVQEECALFGTPNVTIRDVTERPETLECGSNILSGADPDDILAAVRTVLCGKHAWTPPREYLATNVSDVVVRLVLGFRRPGA